MRVREVRRSKTKERTSAKEASDLVNLNEFNIFERVTLPLELSASSVPPH
ncbi:MAG: hypothetical protein ACTS42_01095 [Candidatus Hodgkinia cicadicola]